MGCGASKQPASVTGDNPKKAETAKGPLDRKAILTEIFTAMDVDGDGCVDFEEYKACVQSEMMLKFFAFMDGLGDGDGSLQLKEWLEGMGKLGMNMTDEQFQAELAATMDKIHALPLNRKKLLVGIFQAMDVDGDGSVDFEEYKARASDVDMQAHAYPSAHMPRWHMPHAPALVEAAS